ncbi:ankyrin repeat and zinc finger domain containing protein 1 [Colletotrichum karsti]|uniref:Ankyrin repeat and zinc finger domain containing protein 1 n=1 Tax=Colletotrichum karsti TaxID=1095194 RepID=A0A9P6LH54_9PEZI|nr:ankyrin repeat and zinc finger domain containing protein 1 [Colletotrichum karsti]KAF9872177.1 ankyrin repeat and zinc finger domain containing protein 1 [Colletotrichum karsti]
MGDKNTPELLRRPLYVYDIPAEVLTTLSLKPDASIPDQAPPSPPPKDRASSDLVGSQACSLCGLTFTTVLDQRSHLKSDWHHYNLKQKLRGEKPVTEVDFEKLVGDLDESLSGSDSSESDDDEDDASRKESTLTALLKKQASLADKRNPPAMTENDEEEETSGRKGKGKPPLIWFSSPLLPSNTYFGLYRAILTGEELRDETKLLDVVKKKQLEPIAIPRVPKDGSVPLPAVAYKGPHFFLCMIGGGHFAAMVVSLAPRQNKSSGALNREATVLAHKTFHRYTTRRKQGGSQSANDNAKGAAHSAGSSLRRYNEQALVEDVRELLREWKGLLDTSELLFIRATGATNRRTLFGPYDGQVLKHNDTRIRGFPFNTRRATQNELMRSFIELTRLKVREINPEEPKPQTETSTPTKTPTSKPAKPKLTEEEETALLHTSQIQALIRRTKLPALLSYLKQNDLTPDFQFQPPEQNHHSPTPLHLAAHQSAAPLVLGLLTRGGASPVVTNKDGKTAFDLAGDRATRDAFRVARSELGEDKWDWEAARVPAPLSKADADKRDEREKKEKEGKEAERRRAEEERLRSEGPQVDDKRKKAGLASTAPLKSAQEKREEEARGLTPEMRMKLDRERRARAAEERLKRMQAGG